MAKLSPTNRVQIAEEADHVGVPAPPQIAGERMALIVQRVGSDLRPSINRWAGRRAGGLRLTHNIFFLSGFFLSGFFTANPKTIVTLYRQATG